MIKYDTEAANIQIKGKISDIETEIFWLVRSIYKTIGEDDKKAAEIFKDHMINTIKFAFASDEEINKANSEAKKKTEELINSIKELLDTLDSFKEEEEPIEDHSTEDDFSELFNKFLHEEG